jgi:hypothetical protein
MAVNIGSMSYVSTLDNSDFQAKSLQDLRLIKARLELTGDTSGIRKYDEAFKKAFEDEKIIQAELNKLYDDTKRKVQELAAEQAKPKPSNTVISDSAAEIAAYNASTEGLQTGSLVATKSLAELEAELLSVQGALTQLNELNAAGGVSSETFASGVAALTENEIRLKAAIDGYNVAVEEQIAVNVAASAGLQSQIGLLEQLKINLAELKAQRQRILDPLAVQQDMEALTRINALIQETEVEMSRLNNIGKAGFDAQGIAIARTTNTVDPFNRAISRATNLSQIGATVVSRLTRQIIGLGVGLLSFAIGAKAIEFLVTWISNLDIFTGRLNQAKQNLSAFNDVMKEANQTAGAQIANLRLLYQAATDVNNSFEKRIEAAKQLREQYASEFATATNLAIINGKLKGSYDELTESILQNAKAQAAQNKIATIESTILDAQYQIDLNNRKKQDALDKAKAPTQDEISANNRSGGGPSSLKEVQQSIANQTNFANKQYFEAIKIANAQINFLAQYVGNVGKQSNALADANKLLGNNLQNFNTLIKNASDEGDLQNIKNALEAKLKNLVPSDKQFADLKNKIIQVDNLLKAYQVKLPNQNSANSALQRQIELLNQVKNALATVNSKQLNEDQAALAAISDKFDQLRAKIAIFNNDPANKSVKIGNNVITSINNAQTTAVNSQANLNENKFIADDIEKKKKLYKDYEDYRAKVGTDIANKDYEDLLRSGKDFATYLSNVQASIDVNNKGDQSGPIQARRKLIEDYFKELTEEQRVRLQGLLIQYATYQQQRESIIKVGNDNEMALRKAGATEQANQVAENTNDELTALDEAQFKKLDLYKNTFTNIDKLSRDAAKKQIATLYGVAAAQYAAGKITLQAYLDIIKGLDSASKSLDQTLFDKIDKVNSTLTGLASSFENISPGIASAIKGIQTFVTIGTDAAKSFTAFSNGDILGGITSGISALSGIFSLFGSAKQNAEQLAFANEQQQKSIEAVNKALQRQLEITKQLYGPDRITGYLKQLSDIKAAQDSLNTQLSGKLQLTDVKVINDDLISKLNNGESYNHLIFDDTIVNKFKTSLSLAGKSLEDLQKLMDQGKLDDKTAALVQSLVDLQQQAIDTQNALNQEFTGTSFDDLTSSIVDLFSSATTSAQDFANNFQKIIQAAILNSFKRDYLEKQLQGFYDNLTNLTKKDGTLTATDIATLQAQYNAIIANASDQFKNLQAATGIIFGQADTSTTTLSGAIKASITEDTASIIAGTLKGIQLNTFNTNRILEGHGMSLTTLTLIGQDMLRATVQIQANTLRSADNTDGIADALKLIVTNTSKSADIDLRAAGKYGY